VVATLAGCLAAEAGAGRNSSGTERGFRQRRHSAALRV